MLSEQQQRIVEAPLEPVCVLACAGSGKTKTAVERLKKIREELGTRRSHIALLSFSNVAVNTFRKKYYGKTDSHKNVRVTIDTFDGFITSNILRPHAHRTMRCNRAPFLLTGLEPFLQNKKFKYWYSPSQGVNRPVEGPNINNIVVNINNDKIIFNYRDRNKKYLTNNGREVTTILGSLGAYTHELGKFWSMETLYKQPEILRVLANRYSHIIVDEAQDIGELHQKILELLIEQGVKVTLIGDPNQAIYEFAGATGKFITTFNNSSEIRSFHLSINYRSIPEILKVANAISGRKDTATSPSNNSGHGAYYTTYDSKNPKQLVESFENKLNNLNLSIANSAVLCRGKDNIEKIRVASNNTGQGKIKSLALAAIHRDENADFQKAFKLVVSCVVGLLKETPENLTSMLINPSRYPEARDMSQDIWSFLRSTDEGLPSSMLNGRTTWHDSVNKNLIKLLNKIENKYGYPKETNLGYKLSKKMLTDEPLIPNPELAISKKVNIRLDTVHQAKGESLDAVLYVANKSNVDAFLNGTNTEVGRIGYVALTRARYFFVLAIPKNLTTELVCKLKTIGLKEL